MEGRWTWCSIGRPLDVEGNLDHTSFVEVVWVAQGRCGSPMCLEGHWKGWIIWTINPPWILPWPLDGDVVHVCVLPVSRWSGGSTDWALRENCWQPMCPFAGNFLFEWASNALDMPILLKNSTTPIKHILLRITNKIFQRQITWLTNKIIICYLHSNKYLFNNAQVCLISRRLKVKSFEALSYFSILRKLINSKWIRLKLKPPKCI